jgi:hypothetical protein
MGPYAGVDYNQPILLSRNNIFNTYNCAFFAYNIYVLVVGFLCVNAYLYRGSVQYMLHKH